MKVNVFITLKKSIADPKGKAVKDALNTLDYQEIKSVRMGKLIELEIEEPAPENIQGRVQEMCEKLLANTVMESYDFEIVDLETIS